jgi:DNA-binding NarL/FixJ family response regulator
MTKSKLRVLIVDDHFIIRMGLCGSINCEPDMCVVAEAATGLEALEVYRKFQPDVVLMDLRLPLMTGAEATAAICSEFPEAKVIVLTISAGDKDIWRALQAGAHAYLLKTVQREELLKTIRAVDAGEHRLPPEVAERLAERMSRPPLTNRELGILELIITMNQWLMAIIISSGFRSPPSIQEVADAMSTTHQNVNQIAAGMEWKGLLAMERDPDNKRIIRLKITDRCQAIFQQRNEKDVKTIASMFDNLTDDEMRALFSIIARVESRADQLYKAAKAARLGMENGT